MMKTFHCHFLQKLKIFFDMPLEPATKGRWKSYILATYWGIPKVALSLEKKESSTLSIFDQKLNVDSSLHFLKLHG